jgi:hypothetical protein
MRKLAFALVAALLLTMVPVAGAGAGPSASLGDAAAKKKCKKGYVLKNVKKKKRINGKLRTVTVKKCVKKKKKNGATQPGPTQPGPVSCPTPYSGRATGMDGVFQYGDVRVDRTCGEVTRVEIKSVSTQCNTSSFTFVVVFNPASPDINILEGSSKIVGDKMHVVYQPDKTSANQTTMDIAFTGSTAKGEFHSIGNCKQDGLFTATAG